MKNIFNANNLIKLLGLHVNDERIRELIGQADPVPEITIDKEDDADDVYVEFNSQGVVLYFEEDKLISIFLFSGQADQDYAKYTYPLPMGISFENSKDELIGQLGVPDDQGGGQEGILGKVPVWVKFKMDNYYLHAEFNSNTSGIKMITLMT